jgi:chromosome segregation protein
MYFKKIEISGFKSFANKTTLEFPKPAKNCPLAKGASGKSPLIGEQCGISAIVGPNGSGKSNIADAIRWGLGEQSLKTLRSKKTEDVIFSGTDKKARLSLAEVSLYFNNEDGAIPIDYPQVVISRRLYRNGDTEYLLNKKKVRLGDILMLTAKANFGQKSYSVIGQGTIDSFLNASLAERKEFFDEAAGVKQYQIKRDQSINKLKNTWENLKQAEAVLNEITPHLRSLTRQVNKLERKQKIENELIQIQKKHYFLAWENLEEKRENLQPEFEKLNNFVSKKKEMVLKIQSQLNAIEKQDSRSEQFNKLQQKYQKVVDQKNKLLQQQIILESKIELAKQKRKTIKTLPVVEIVSQLKKISDESKKLLSKISDISNLDELDILKEKATNLTAKINDLLNKLENPNQKATTDPTTAELIKKLESLTSEIKQTEEEIERVRKEFTDFNRSQDEQKSQLFSLQKQFQKEQNDYHSAVNQLNDVKIELAKIETRRDDLNLEIKHELGDTAWLNNFKPEGQTNEAFLASEIQRLKRQLELIGGIDPEVTKEYQQTKKRHDFLEKQTTDLKKSIADLKTVISNLDKTIQKQFDESFKTINKEFQKYFKILFQGGRAELILVKETEVEKALSAKKQSPLTEDEQPFVRLQENQSDPEESTDAEIQKIIKSQADVIKGIEIEACPPGKKLKSINMLSGGEKAMTSIALICAIIASNPSPFVVLDEVDAALDEANSERFAAILDELAHRTQFIVITHNRATMHKANILYGVSMGEDGVSKLLSLKLEEAELASK